MIPDRLVTLTVEGEGARSAQIEGPDGVTTVDDLPEGAVAAFDQLVDRFPGHCLAWRDRRVDAALTPTTTWPRLLRNVREVRHAASLHRADALRSSIGAAHFVSPFLLPASPDQPFPTWLLSPLAGIATTDMLRQAGPRPPDPSFATALLVLGHRAMQAGALLWSDPRLTTGDTRPPDDLTDREAAFVVRHTAGRKFVPLWAFTRLADRRLPLLAAADAMRRRGTATVPGVPPALDPPPAPITEVDVVIATMGRRPMLRRVLEDLATQTATPNRVVVVEQVAAGQREPGPLDLGPLPYELVYQRLTTPGACNARNVGLLDCRAHWALLADDDMRFGPDFIEQLVDVANRLTVDVVVSGISIGELDDRPGRSTASGPAPHMWPALGAGNSLARRSLFDEAGGFDRRLDGGFGEDYEWAVRARRHGAMVVSAPAIRANHLKAPTGGLRTPHPHPWRGHRINPSPSPTVILSRRLSETPSMRRGWVAHFWLRRLLKRWPAGPVTMRREWRAANQWAQRLERSQSTEAAIALEP